LHDRRHGAADSRATRRCPTIDTPSLQLGEALVEVHAAAITRDELEWPLDRLLAVPSHELSGIVAAVADDIGAVSVGDEVMAMVAWPSRSLTTLRRPGRRRPSAPGQFAGPRQSSGVSGL
jgi:NADPH:quinone reductase-like Zn-dependent oxidoreductase